MYRYLKSTISNIQLISQFRVTSEDAPMSQDAKVFEFWMEFLIEATKDHYSNSQFPVSYSRNEGLSLYSVAFFLSKYMYIFLLTDSFVRA